jgi:surface antigen
MIDVGGLAESSCGPGILLRQSGAIERALRVDSDYIARPAFSLIDSSISRWRTGMSIPVKPLVLLAASFICSAAHAQLLGLAWESNISLTQEDINLIRETVNQQVHGKPAGTTASWSNPNSRNSGTIKLLKKFTARNMRCEQVGYTLQTTAMAVAPEHYELNSCLQPDGTWKII